MLRCVNVFFVGFEFVYMRVVVSNLRSVFVIRYLLNTIGLLSHNLLALSSLRLSSFELPDNQNFEMILVLYSGWKIILKLIE